MGGPIPSTLSPIPPLCLHLPRIYPRPFCTITRDRYGRLRVKHFIAIRLGLELTFLFVLCVCSPPCSVSSGRRHPHRFRLTISSSEEKGYGEGEVELKIVDLGKQLLPKFTNGC